MARPILTEAERKRIKTPYGFLRKMDKVLSTSRRWTKNASARTMSGRSVSASNSAACQFCLSGAAAYIIEPYYSNGSNGITTPAERIRTKAMRILETVVPQYSIIAFNDSPDTTFRDVKLALKKAIAKARGVKV
jgi:hypothetical protein